MVRVRQEAPGVKTKNAKVAQLVEHDLAKVRVAGSNPVFRSFLFYMFPLIAYMYMQMDINKIFDLFGSAEFDTPLEKKAKAADDLILIQETPMFWIGMFKKIILNNQVFYHQLKSHLPEELLKEIAQGDNMADMVTYSRAWFYISKLDLKRRVDVDALSTFTDVNLLYATEMALCFFEGKEEYEKCAHIKKIQDTIKKLLDKA